MFTAIIVSLVVGFIAGAYVESKFSASFNDIVSRIEAAVTRLEAVYSALRAKL